LAHSRRSSSVVCLMRRDRGLECSCADSCAGMGYLSKCGSLEVCCYRQGQGLLGLLL
jgi:hypothetical protein